MSFLQKHGKSWICSSTNIFHEPGYPEQPVEARGCLSPFTNTHHHPCPGGAGPQPGCPLSLVTMDRVAFVGAFCAASSPIDSQAASRRRPLFVSDDCLLERLGIAYRLETCTPFWRPPGHLAGGQHPHIFIRS